MCDHSLIGKHILPHSLLLFLSWFLYWRKILCVIVLMHESWEKTSGIIIIKWENTSSLTLLVIVFLYWRIFYEMSNFALTWIQNKKSNQRKHTPRFTLLSFFVSLLKENLSCKKGKNGKKKGKILFSRFQYKTKVFVEILIYFFPFSLFPPKKDVFKIFGIWMTRDVYEIPRQ